MYKKLFLAIAISAVFIAQTNITSAQNITVVTPLEAIQTMILQIQKQINTLREQIALMTTKPQVTPPVVTTQTNSPKSVSASVSTSSQVDVVPTSTEVSIIIPLNREVSGPNNNLPTDTTVTILSPNGGEVWQIGSTHTIKWRLNAGSSSEAFKTSILLRSVDAGVRETIITISTTTLSIDGENWLAWIVPQTVSPASNYRMYVQMNQMTYTSSLIYSTGTWGYPNDESNENISIISGAASVSTTSASIFDSFLSFFRKLFK